jgi:hypothetical protein
MAPNAQVGGIGSKVILVILTTPAEIASKVSRKFPGGIARPPSAAHRGFFQKSSWPQIGKS